MISFDLTDTAIHRRWHKCTVGEVSLTPLDIADGPPLNTAGGLKHRRPGLTDIAAGPPLDMAGGRTPYAGFKASPVA